MKNIYLIAICFLALTQGAFSEKVLSVSMDICRNDSVKARAIDLEDAYPSRYISQGIYRLEIVNGSGAVVYKTDFNMAFVLLTNPPKTVDCSPINMRIPYRDSMNQLSIYRNDTKIFSRTLSLCNNNGMCNPGYETFLSCPGDCPLDRKDGICLSNVDGACDPDCDPGVDPDCAAPSTEPVTTTIREAITTTTNATLPKGNEKPSDILLYLPYAMVLTVIVIAAYFIYKKREDAKIKREREEFRKWKDKEGTN